MFLKVRLTWNVVVHPENLDATGSMLKKSIVEKILHEFAAKKATKDLGYFLAVSDIESIGEGKVRMRSGEVVFPVSFNAMTFNVFSGEVLIGDVQKVTKNGVMLRTGPIENVYISAAQMPGFSFVGSEDGAFVSEKMGKIQKDVSVRFVVVATKWFEPDREFRVLASVEGEFLGPV